MGDVRPTPEMPAGNANLQVRGQEKAKQLAEKPEINWANRRKIFTLFLLMNLLLNYDTGVIPASLVQVKREIHMSFQEQAALGSLVYLGLCTASLIVSTVFQQFSAAKTMIWMLSLNAGFCLLFSLSYNLYLMYMSRIGMGNFHPGFTQAFCVIYGPVWTNEFSPPEHATRWMGLLQSFVPLGIMLGYTCAGLIVNFLSQYTTWRFAIQIQAMMIVPVAYALSRFDPADIDVINVSTNSKSIRIDTINISQLANFWNSVALLFSNGIFVSVTLALCMFYFVVTGIQYWITVYLIEVLGSDPIKVLISFSATCISAPLVGVMVGSYIADHLGGYKGRNLIHAIKLCTLCSLLACFFAIPIGYVGSLFYVVPLLWILLFFGGAMSPTATGINVNAVGREYQSASSSFSQLIFNLGGYFMAPVLSAFVMDQFPDPIVGLQWGFRMVLGMSVGGMVFLLAAWVVAARRMSKEGYLDFEEEGDQVGELKGFPAGEVRAT